jgi:hypothetical protein
MASGRIEKGQPLSTAISAAAWNRAQDAADIVLGSTPGQSAEPSKYAAGASNVVLIRNDSGVDLKVCGILGISGFAISPSAAEEMPSIVTLPVVIGQSPVEATHLTNFAITLEPISAGKVGRAAICGVVAFRLVDRDGSHKYATVQTGFTDRLQSTACGSLQILARGSTAGDGWKWALGAL